MLLTVKHVTPSVNYFSAISYTLSQFMIKQETCLSNVDIESNYAIKPKNHRTGTIDLRTNT